MRPQLDPWIPAPIVSVHHRRESHVDAPALWAAARAVRVRDTRHLGRLISLRIPGVRAEVAYDELFRSLPFNVLEEHEGALVSGLVGRIWTLRRDYPRLDTPTAFRDWKARGTVRVLFATWVESLPDAGSVLINETRVDAVDRAARIGLATLAPLIARSHRLIGSEGLELAGARAEAQAPARQPRS